jgi:hypothetical protein
MSEAGYKTSKNEAVAALICLVKSRQYVSFTEIGKMLNDHIVETNGDRIIECGSNVVLWNRMSAEYVDIVLTAVRDGKIFGHPCSVLSYVVDGGYVPNYPLAKRAASYAKPHWCPVCFCDFPQPSARKKRQPKGREPTGRSVRRETR